MPRIAGTEHRRIDHRIAAEGRAGDGPLAITQSGTDGDDTLTGTDGNDRLDGLRGNDLIDGGAGQDVITGGIGNDTIHGGEGNDAIQSLHANNGGGGNSADEIYGEGGNDYLQGCKGTDQLRGGFGDDRARGFAGDDFLSGNDGADELIGDDGSDRLLGGDGNDALYGYNNQPYGSGEGYDSLWGGQGDDTLVGGRYYSPRDLLDGGAGNDVISGGGTILGGDGDDVIDGLGVIHGGSGDDDILGYGGPITGGEGADRIHARDPQDVDGGSQPDGAVDYMIMGWDRLGTTSFDLVACANGVAQTIGFQTIVNIEQASFLLGGAGTIRGGAYDDRFIVYDGDTTIYGAGGDDRLAAHGLLVGGDGADTLSSGSLADTFNGGRGADELTPGGGADTLVYASVKDSFRASMDLIFELSIIDVIDLAAIDADVTQAGDQAFVLVDELTGVAGQLTVHHEDGKKRSFILGDVDGDGRSDLCISTFGDDSGYANFVL